MTSLFLIYGSYGYTGQLAVETAVAKGMKPILAGRNAQALKKQAAKYQLEYKAFSLEDTAKLEQALLEVKAVLHIAGPYSETAVPMLEACLKTQTHYLDITGELEVFEWLEAQDQRAIKAGISIIPGVGFDVVPTDCLAAYLRQQMPDATHLELGFKGAGSISRGTARTMLQNIGEGGSERKNGRITNIPAAAYTRTLPFGKRESLAVSIPWGDVATAYYSTGIENIRVYMATTPQLVAGMKATNWIGWLMATAPVQMILKQLVDQMVKGPTDDLRENSKSYVWGEVRNTKGECKQASLETLEAYKLTALTAIEATRRVIAQEVPAGFHTPSQAFGADFILHLPNTLRKDLL